MELTKTEALKVKEAMLLFSKEVKDIIQIIDNVAIELETEKKWTSSMELAKVKQKLMDLIS